MNPQYRSALLFELFALLYFGTNLNFVIFIVPSVLLRRGVPSSNSGAGPSFIVGSKSTQTSPGGFLMRSLAVWTRSLSSQEVNTVFLAGKKNFSENVMFILKQRNCVAQYRTWDIQTTQIPQKRIHHFKRTHLEEGNIAYKAAVHQ